MAIDIRVLGPSDEDVLTRVAQGMFDHDVDPALSSEFLHDPRHHLAVALDEDTVVGFASGVHYVHPDKPAELWINEVGVAPTHRGHGIGRRLVDALLERGRSRGCRQSWVATEPGNVAARRLYAAAGGRESPDPFVMVEFDLG